MTLVFKFTRPMLFICVRGFILYTKRNGFHHYNPLQELSSVRFYRSLREIQTFSPYSFNSVTIEFTRAALQITVPLPSRLQLCRFTLRPIVNTVGDLIKMIQEEDHGIDIVFINTMNGVRIASSNPVESLLEQDFKMLVNDIEYRVKAPLEEHMNEEEIETLNNIRKVVDQLHVSLNIEETQLKLEQELLSQLEEVLQELQPLEEMRNHIDGVSNRYTNALVWVGLGLMATQFGILARLTWWEYSWDIMEPITYFVTYGTAMIAYCYYLATKQEFDMPRAKDRQHLIIFHRKARKRGLDIKRYNSLKEKVFEIEGQLHELNYSVNGNKKFN